MEKESNIYLSLITVPYNDGKEFHIFIDELLRELNKLNKPYEIIVLDSYTENNSEEIMKSYVQKFHQLKYYLVTHPGVAVEDKTRKYMLGFQEARGKFIITMDSDRQDRPEDIPLFLEKLEDGYYFVSGYKHKRKDAFFYRLTSFIANTLVRKLTGVKIHDMNNGFKGFQSFVAKNLRLRGGYFRFLPVILQSRTFKMTEVMTKHIPRAYGNPKFNFLSRLQGGLFDMLALILIKRMGETPMYVVGWSSLTLEVIGVFLILLDVLLLDSVRVFIIAIAAILLGIILFFIVLISEANLLSEKKDDYSRYIVRKYN